MVAIKHHIRKQRALAQWRHSITIFLKIYFDSLTIQLLILGVSLLSCIYYIIETYTHDENMDIEIFFFTTFLFDYIMCVAEAGNKFDYISSPMGLADFSSMIPLVGIFLTDSKDNIQRWPASWIGFLRFSRLLKIFHVLR